MRTRELVSWRFDSALAMPSATSSANDASRVSAPAGNGRGFEVDIATAPHSRPSMHHRRGHGGVCTDALDVPRDALGVELRIGVDPGRGARAVDAL